MELVGLRGERVTLVPSEANLHLENALRWFNDPRVTARLLVNAGVTRREEEAFFERMALGRDTDLHWAIVAEGLGHVGFIGLHEISWRLRKATGGLMIGEPSAWGRGIATEAVRIRTRFAIDQLGLHRIEGHSINPAMWRVYEKAGYRAEGVARQLLWRDGFWHDARLYAILDTDDRDDQAKSSLTTTP
jgi:RimJ/RimL family protein N-acetyltransferase